jgi:regulator of sigma E protease
MFSSSFLWSLGGFFIVLTPIILVHELGHFIAARLSNIRVEEFGFGFPPRALKLGERNGTVFSLNWIPLGGFVRPAGEDDPSVPGGLAGASKRARFFVLSAGAGANLIMAVVVFWLAQSIGTPAIAVSRVDPGSPAEAVGLQEGDIFWEVNGKRAESNVIGDEVRAHAGEPVELVMLRNGEKLVFTIVPRLPGEYNEEVEGPIGVGLAYNTQGVQIKENPVTAVGSALRTTWEYTRLFFEVPAMLIRGDIAPSEARPVSVVGISQMAGQVAEVSVTNSNIAPLLSFIGFINVALALTNLLPIPALDGGRILFVLIEAVRGRRIEPEREGMVHIIGMALLLGLMVILIVQDIINPLF